MSITPKVDNVSPLVQGMMTAWTIINDLMGGTLVMRAKGNVYLPRFELELEKDYEARLKSATLFPGFSETVKKMVGRMFNEPLQVSEDTPDWIAGRACSDADTNTDPGIFDDIDLQRENVQLFARSVAGGSLSKGHWFVLVDSPKAQQPVATLADQKAQGIRPYCISVSPERVLGWKQDKNGKLVQVRITFNKEVDNGEFSTGFVEQVHVYYIGRVDVWEKRTNAAGEVIWELNAEDSSTNTLEEIPIVCFYSNRTGFFQSKSLLEELAHLNIKHYQQQSSADSLVETAMVPILAIIGGNTDEKAAGEGVKIGGKAALELPMGASAEYVEHTGAALKSGFESLQEIKSQMRDAGAKLLEPGSGRGATSAGPSGSPVKTATQSGEEAAAENSALGTFCEDFEDSFCELMRVIGLWNGQKAGTGAIELQPNLDPGENSKDVMDVLTAMSGGGKLSSETLFNEAKKRKYVSEDILWDDEKARIESEPDFLTPPMATAKPPGAPAPAPTPPKKAPAAAGA
jgi:hypothetical protein